MKQILRFLAFSMTAMSCHSGLKPSPEQMSQEKITLVQVLKANKYASDVFGDTLKTYEQYYVYSKKTANLIPISMMTEAGDITLNNYLTALVLLGKDGSDTVNLIIGEPKETITVKQFRLKNVRVSNGKLYR